MLNAGFQYLEQRDANDKITKDGVVGKNSPFATSDNSGIYDVIAEDLRWLKENVDDVKDTSDLEAIKQSVTDMYNDMKNDSSFGEATAKAQAEEAKKQAQVALESATNAKTYYDDITTKSTEVNDTIAEIKSYIEKAEALVESNKTLEQSISDSATVATNKAKSASDSASNAATSETNAKASETNAKTSETNAKVSETNAAKSESNAKAHMDATATSESNAKTSETNAKASQTASKTSETNAKTSETNAKQYSINSSNSADLAKAWAESSNSPDSVNDTDSTTSKTQSSKSWAIYSKDRAISAFKSETNAKASETASKTSETNAADSASRAKASETSASTSAVNAATSASNAKTSETNAKTSETNASASKTDAATSETNAKSYMATAKEYMQKAQEALAAAQAIQSLIDTSKANAEKCLADVEAVKESLAKMITYQGSVDNYSDLPTNPQVGYSYNVKNADKTHGVNAGDNLVWNGTDWDNFGSYVDMSLFAELGKDVRFNSVTATLNGNAATASKLASPRTISLSGKAAGSTTFDGSANASINVTNVNADTASKLSTARKINITGNATGAANFDGSGDVSINVSVNSAAKATNDKNGADIAATYLKKAGGTATGKITFNSTDLNALPEVKKTSDDNMSGVRFSSKSKFLGAVGKRLSNGEDLLNLRSDNTTTDVVLDSRNYGSYALPKSGGTMSGALNFANSTWNLVGDDSYMGDHDISGTFCVKGANGETGIALCNKANDADYARISYGGGNINFNKTIGGNISGNAATATRATTATNADKLDGYRASDLLKKIAAANTVGIVAASLTANGYVKFANGFIIQWGNASGRRNTENSTSFPIAFPSTCFTVLLSPKRYIVSASIISQSKTSFTWGAECDSVSWIAVGI